MKHVKHTSIALGAVACLAFGTVAAFAIPWWTIDGGGTTFATGGGWTLAGTIGQHEASEPRALSGGDWQLTGGFWVEAGELSGDQPIFSDRFEE